ncbi:MAG TPA: redoxin domain-containing protein [Thermaerobacter sp.]
MASEARPEGGQRPDPAGSPSTAARRRRWVALAAVLVLAAAFAAGVRHMQQAVANRPQVGRPAPDFTLSPLDGKPVRLANLRGRVVALNFWATWCPPCREETPALQAFYERYGDRVAYYGINVAEPVDTVRRFLAEFGVTYPVLLDREKEVARRYGVAAYPETWWIDRDGVARVHWIGPMTFEDMQRLYEQTAGEPIDPEGSGPVAPGERLLDLAVDGVGRAWAATSDGLWHSQDGGVTWRPVAALRGTEVTAVLWLPAGSGPAAGAGGGGGGSGGPGGDGDAVQGRLLVAGSSFGLRVSEDGGRTWRDAGDGLPAPDVTAIAASPSGRVLYAWVAGHGLYRRDAAAGGGRWQQVPGDLGPSLERVGLLVLDDEGRYLLAAASGGLFYSEDGGRTWREAGLEEPLLDAVPVAAAQAGAGARGERGAAAGASGPVTVLLGGQEGLWRATWTAGDGADSGRVGGAARLPAPARAWAAVAIAPGGRYWLAAAPNGDLVRSTDGGARWEYVRGRRAP